MTNTPANPEATPWHGDWRQRLALKLPQLGYSDLDAFLGDNPAVGYVTLAAMCGDASIAAMQIVGEQIRLAVEHGAVRAAARDSLIRFINEYVPRGWGMGKHFAHRSASAFAAWKTTLQAHMPENPSVDAMAKRLLDELESQSIPLGWLPRGPSDPFITAAFDSAWPAD